ncbi:putative proline racemase A [Streptomyces viridochromogenes Tue57]|uniref:Putative proline racemase A n=1 Tax=Streptomyces viridochromogenes Tue57 TaxID=1160705 RepID=L8P3B4_STRVR|nr:proline racemase family protein [Streptomyces viridochromogenes]ELS50634.1 putative proline racemase A [Streptomyces viridochromogenes Tue57]
MPAFAVALDHVLDLPEYGRVPVDIVFGGQFFVQARAEDLGLTLVPSAAKRIARAGAVLRAVAQREFPVRHPLSPGIGQICLTMIHGPSPTPGASGRNAVVLPNGEVRLPDRATWTGSLDRSPCGTGTGGRMAACTRAANSPSTARSSTSPSPVRRSRARSSTPPGSGRTRRCCRRSADAAGSPDSASTSWTTPTPSPYGYTLGDLWGAGEQER